MRLRGATGRTLEVCQARRSSPAPVFFAAIFVQVNKAQRGRFGQGNSLLFGDGAERIVDVRQVICGNVVDEGAMDFVVAKTAMQPAQEHDELHADGKQHG